MYDSSALQSAMRHNLDCHMWIKHNFPSAPGLILTLVCFSSKPVNKPLLLGLHQPALGSDGLFSAGQWWLFVMGIHALLRPPIAAFLQSWMLRAVPQMSHGLAHGNQGAVRGPGACWSSTLKTGGKTTTLVLKVSFHERGGKRKQCTVAKSFPIIKCIVTHFWSRLPVCISNKMRLSLCLLL